MHESGLAGASRVRRLAQEVRGHPLQHQGGGGLELHPVRHDHRSVGRNDDLLGVAAVVDHGPRNPVPDGKVGDAGAERTHRARALRTQHERQLPRVDARALVDVDEVHASGRDVHEHLARARLGGRDVLDLQSLRPTGLFDDNCAHVSSFKAGDVARLPPKCHSALGSCVADHAASMSDYPRHQVTNRLKQRGPRLSTSRGPQVCLGQALSPKRRRYTSAPAREEEGTTGREESHVAVLGAGLRKQPGGAGTGGCLSTRCRADTPCGRRAGRHLGTGPRSHADRLSGQSGSRSGSPRSGLPACCGLGFSASTGAVLSTGLGLTTGLTTGTSAVPRTALGLTTGLTTASPPAPAPCPAPPSASPPAPAPCPAPRSGLTTGLTTGTSAALGRTPVGMLATVGVTSAVVDVDLLTGCGSVPSLDRGVRSRATLRPECRRPAGTGIRLRPFVGVLLRTSAVFRVQTPITLVARPAFVGGALAVRVRVVLARACGRDRGCGAQ